jgi:hypothetical protein
MSWVRLLNSEVHVVNLYLICRILVHLYWGRSWILQWLGCICLVVRLKVIQSFQYITIDILFCLYPRRHHMQVCSRTHPVPLLGDEAARVWNWSLIFNSEDITAWNFTSSFPIHLHYFFITSLFVCLFSSTVLVADEVHISNYLT